MTIDQTVTQALEPCPFCGGDELSHGWDSPGIDGSAHTGNVECHACNVLLYQGTEAEAITAWNTRIAHSGEGRSNGAGE
jgi:Lar family restriction alleviation protein